MRVTARELATPRRRTPLPRRERDVQAAILTALRAIPGVVAWKSGAGAFRVDGRFVRMGHKGVSDIVGFCRRQVTHVTSEHVWTHYAVAQFLAIEVKAKGKQPTDEQRAFLDAVQAAGGIAVCAYDVQDVIEALK